MDTMEPDPVCDPDGVARSQSEADELIGALCRHAAALLGAAPGPVRRIRVQSGGASVEVEWPEAVPPPPAAVGAVTTVLTGPAGKGAAAEAVQGQPPSELHLLRAPTVGVFYRAPAPGAKPFVEVGDKVEKGQQVAILEAMKLMNRIEADRSGRVVDILVADGTPVEFDQPLVAMVPSDHVDGRPALDSFP
jgi:acetyl-CoA carboxylase biotin carboxyl carrier protein